MMMRDRARRFAEAGVRFIELSFPGWDQHQQLKAKLNSNAAGIDQPIAALINDLKQRGMLKDTLLIWGGEFGRTPHAQFRALFAPRGCEICQLDLTHCGGFTEARRIAALAEAHRIALAPHNPQGPVSTAASLEFGFSQPSYIICETVHADVPWRQDVVQEGFQINQATRTVT